jgi:hypothetical protein
MCFFKSNGALQKIYFNYFLFYSQKYYTFDIINNDYSSGYEFLKLKI